MYEKQLRKSLEEQNDVLKKLELIDSNLKREEENIYTKDFLLDRSIKPGYSLENDEVYYFDKENLVYQSEKLYDLKQIQYESPKLWYLSRFTIFLISLCTSVFITGFAFLLRTKKKDGEKDGIKQE